MNEAEAVKILSISRPFSKARVLTQFRSCAKEIHPDTGRTDGGFSFADMDDLVKAKDLLLKIANEKIDLNKTITGELLSELGNGLPNNKTGKTCKTCEGKGWDKRVMVQWLPCPSCHGSSYSPFWKNTRISLKFCLRCNNQGEIRSAIYDVKYEKCYDCKGSGENEIFNPLIPKGRLT